MIAVLVNCLSVIVGSVIGLLGTKKITDRFSDVVCSAAGIVTIVIGLQMALQYENIIYLSLSLILGGVFGNYLAIDEKILRMGTLLEGFCKRYSNKRNERNVPTDSRFAYGFLNASVLFCVGAMAILGSFKAGIEKDYTLIFTKSVLDGFMAIVFTAAFGIGTIFSAMTIFLYQGILTLASQAFAPFVSEQMITEISAIGGAMVIMIGINLLKLREIKTANFLPSVIFTLIFVLLDPFIKTIFAQII